MKILIFYLLPHGGFLFFYFMLELQTAKLEQVTKKPVASELSSLTETDKTQIIEIFLQTYYKYPLTVDQLRCFMDDPNTKVVTVKENGIIYSSSYQN